ncbi:MAG: poly(R)-hydroxyalkanoic acid synthase subunit PhaE, partial [Betaproteobacteria bacterium]
RTSVEATEKIMAELARKIENSEDISKFDDFFALWVEINEKTFHQLFETSDFAKINGDVLTASLDARKNYFKMMETAMADLPVALRSEMDDLYKTVYELRKEVNKMKSQMKKENS